MRRPYDGNEIVVYAETRALIEAAVPPRLLALGRLERWHPEQGWKDPDRWADPGPAAKGGAGVDVLGDGRVVDGMVEALIRLFR